MKNHNRPKNASPKKLSPATSARAAEKTAQNNGPRHAAAHATTHTHDRDAALRLPAGDVLFGVHAVHAALANPDRDILALYVTEATVGNLPTLKRGLRPTVVSRGQLDHVLQGAVHQGIAAVTKPLPEYDIDDVLRSVEDKNGGLVVLLDQVTDPHNVGAILRSSAVFGAAAVVVTERNAPSGQHGILAKSASGALEQVPLVRVVNLARTLELLGEADFWRIGLAESGNVLGPDTLVKLPPRVALVLGAEGDGLRRLTKERCDELLALPVATDFTTLNVSNAAAVALYALSQRLGQK